MHMRKLILVPLGALLLAACTGASTGTGPPGTPRTSAPAPSPAPALALLTVTPVQYWRGIFFTEGAVSYLRLVTPEGAVALRQDFPNAPLFHPLIEDRPVQPGRYRVISYQRSCDGSCLALDPPRGRCSAPLELGSGDAVVVTIELEPPKRCAMSVEARAEIGERYPYTLYTHCGIGHVFFDGRTWVPRGQLVEGMLPSPQGLGDPFEKGTMRLITEELLRFTGRSGGRVGFEPLPRDSAAHFFACE